ncbi:hypothetical protein EON83_18525 [bacterium]|nr:MAG: hypothetical protein EON83_18525 [bacterium]
MQFLLPPWDRNRIRIQIPQADSLVALGGKTFALRAQNGLLFFRDITDPAKTWAISTSLTPELEADSEAREQFFVRESGKGNVARYVVYLDSYLERTVPLFFHGDGTGWCRESWNRDDIPFTHAVSMHVLMEGADATITENLRDVQSQLEQRLSSLDWPEDVNWYDDESKIEWMCGSREGLQQVLGWICAMESSFWNARGTQSVGLQVASETPFSRAHICEIAVGPDNNRDELSLEADSQSDEISIDYGFSAQPGFDTHPLPSRRFWTLCDLALDENTPLGTYWEYRDYGMGRSADAPNPMWFSFKFEVPSAHEVEAAMTHLKAWLRGKVPISEIETLLHDETPCEFPKKEW